MVVTKIMLGRAWVSPQRTFETNPLYLCGSAGLGGLKIAGLPPQLRKSGYLHDVLTRLPKRTNWQIKDVTPEAWAKSRQRPPLKAAS